MRSATETVGSAMRRGLDNLSERLAFWLASSFSSSASKLDWLAMRGNQELNMKAVNLSSFGSRTILIKNSSEDTHMPRSM